ncbi:OLC1v1017161C1 [Oldenlandia corymbosa var. corymbosa]|uniref:OLC1v1017161C1 n=1 Tax=Oldenlandia corymbosa var. corymbosa TaxID=529605 RepID=A0AAV1E8X1_OLDCO|nr:OLC1v1017161C1 [Oldenlandia corymbosa var. corymbosa]
MENYPYNNPSYPDSVNSSPRSRDIDPENASWDEPLSSSSNNYKVKFMCSYGGKIRPRPHDNQLTYMGGDTKIVSVDRNIKFSTFISKLSSLSDSAEVCFKYQLPGEDLDALISVTNDEDLEHMMLEYDRLHRSISKPARLRLFIFPANGNPPSVSSFGSDDSKPETQWFLDALNAAQVNQNPKDNSTPQSTAAVGAAVEPTRVPDYLFGLEKGGHRAPPSKLRDPSPEVTPPAVVVGEPVVTPADIQRQMHELQRLQISSQEHEMYGRKVDEYYQPKPPPQPAQPLQQVTPDATAAYWPERQGQQHFPPGIGVGATEGPPMYLIQTPAGVYQAPVNVMRPPMTGQVNQPYYGVPRMVPEQGYREQPPAVYNPMGPPVSSSIIQHQQQPQPKPGGGAAYNNAEGIGLVRPSVGLGPPPPPLEPGYAQVSFDNAGRQVYYAAPGGVNVMQQPPPPPPPYQAMPPVTAQVIDGRQAGTLNPDGKILVKNSH